MLLSSCKSKQIATSQVAVVAESKPAPPWVSNRPNNSNKYIGIGFVDKLKSNNYQIEAKKNALYDLSSEIKVNIASNSVLYTVQNNNNFNETFNSMIKLSNTDNIEGYQLVDSYENDKSYWVYYSLDKEEYAKQKALKKQQIITKASNLISLSFADEKNKDFSASLKKRIQAFGVLTPYLSEEINFDPSATNGIKTVFDLTNSVQQQLQSITVIQPKLTSQLKPYQQVYIPLSYTLQLKNNTSLANFPLIIVSEEDRVKVTDKANTTGSGELQVKVNYVEPVNQMVSFALSPDISALMGGDSVGRAGIAVLKQFINTPSLRVYANVSPITLYINSLETNFGKPTGLTNIATFIGQKFNGQEVRIVSKPDDADFIIESLSDTKEDVSSDVLEKNYNIKLATLVISLELRSKLRNEVLYKSNVSDIFGYANNLEKAGINAYQNEKLNAKLGEAIFFLKRKILVY